LVVLRAPWPEQAFLSLAEDAFRLCVSGRDPLPVRSRRATLCRHTPLTNGWIRVRRQGASRRWAPWPPSPRRWSELPRSFVSSCASVANWSSRGGRPDTSIISRRFISWYRRPDAVFDSVTARWRGSRR